MKKIFLNLILMLALIGCAVASSTASIKGKEYTLNNTDITLIFDKNENKFYGKAVNNYFGVYAQKGSNIKLELQGSTMMMGEPQKMEQETKYFNNLNQVATYSINGNNLTLKGDNVELTFTENK